MNPFGRETSSQSTTTHVTLAAPTTSFSNSFFSSKPPSSSIIPVVCLPTIARKSPRPLVVLSSIAVALFPFIASTKSSTVKSMKASRENPTVEIDLVTNDHNREGFVLLIDAIERTGHTNKIKIGMNVATSKFLTKDGVLHVIIPKDERKKKHIKGDLSQLHPCVQG